MKMVDVTSSLLTDEQPEEGGELQLEVSVWTTDEDAEVLGLWHA